MNLKDEKKRDGKVRKKWEQEKGNEREIKSPMKQPHTDTNTYTQRVNRYL